MQTLLTFQTRSFGRSDSKYFSDSVSLGVADSKDLQHRVYRDFILFVLSDSESFPTRDFANSEGSGLGNLLVQVRDVWGKHTFDSFKR